MSEEINLSIREVTPDDAEILADYLQLEEANLDNLAYVSNFEDEELKTGLENIYFSDTNTLLLALDGFQPIGLISIAGKDGKLVRHIGELGIFISEAYRNIGLGTIMVEETLNWVAEDSLLTRIELQVQTRNKHAIALYENFSFKKEGTIKNGARVNGTYYDTYLMAYLMD